MWLINSILLTVGLILLTIGVFKKYIRWDILFTKEEREKVLVSISVVFAAGTVGIYFTALIEGNRILSAVNPSLTLPFLVLMLALIFHATLVGTLISFFMFKTLKWVFDV